MANTTHVILWKFDPLCIPVDNQAEGDPEAGEFLQTQMEEGF